MGYDLHITRAKSWTDAGKHPITAAEWLAHVARDPELTLYPPNGPYFALWSGKSIYPDPWLDWSKGTIHTKNPDEALIDKMVAIARALDANVLGDDGEIYRSGHEPPVYPAPSLKTRFQTWLQTLRPQKPLQPIVPPYKIGDRVLDVFRKETTVIAIDPTANHGLGRVRVRYDDGRESSSPLRGSALTPIPANPPENKNS